MAKTPRNYPETMASAESGRPMIRREKLVTLKVDGRTFEYLVHDTIREARLDRIYAPLFRGLVTDARN